MRLDSILLVMYADDWRNAIDSCTMSNEFVNLLMRCKSFF